MIRSSQIAMILTAMLFSWLLLAPTSVSAQAAQHITATLHAETSTPRPGATTRVAIRMTPQSGWHGYWINPGDSGLSVEADWQAPDGVQMGPLRHPAPTLLELAGLASYVHKGAFTLMADMRVPANVAAGTAIPLRANLSWLACSDTLCVPERSALDLQMVVGNGTPDPGLRALFRSADAAMPVPGDRNVRIERAADHWQFTVTGTSGLNRADARLFPSESGWFDASTSQNVRRDAAGDLTISVPASAAAPQPDFTGVVSDGRSSVSIAGAVVESAATGVADPVVPTASDVSAPRADVEGQSDQPPASSLPVTTSVGGETPALWVALMGAVIGGLILNLMPCVFPILSLKALSLVKSGGDTRTARVEGVSYFAGSVLTTTALGGILVAARSLGHDIGWSFQLQDPRIILLLMLLSLAIALNLAGLFEIRGPSVSGGWMARRGWTGAFGTGALAALIATPCSGPFMGVALGAALVLPPAAALAVFAGLGLGMALPFVLIAFVPRLQRLLPKPGAWMETFRHILAIPMLLTAIGLAWVLGRQSGVDGLTIGLLIASLAGLGLWWAGQRQAKGHTVARTLVPVAAALLIAVTIQLPKPNAAAATQATGAEPFSVERLSELRAAGTPVFVDFTADWCLICQVNKRVAIDRPDTRDAFARAGVVTLVADWTRGDPAITRYLASRGRNSIPYYLYATQGAELRELPQVLTSDLLIAQAAGR